MFAHHPFPLLPQVPYIQKDDDELAMLLCTLVGEILFAHLDERELCVLVGAMRMETYHKGDYLFRQVCPGLIA